MIKKLIAIRLRAMLAAANGKSKKGSGALSNARLAGFVVLYCFVGLVFAGLFALTSFGMALIMLPLGQDAMYYGMLMTIAFVVVLFLSVFETKSELFDCKDNELLLSMPISPRDIILSRIFAVLSLNYVETAVVMLPATVIYALMGGSAFGIVGGIAVTLLLPLPATALSAAIGYLVAIISRKLKNNSILTTLVTVVLVGVFYVGYFAMLNPEDEIIGSSMAVMAQNPFMAAIGSAALLNPIAISIFVVASVGIAYLAYRIILSGYSKILTSTSSAKKVVYRSKKAERHSVLRAVAQKELRRFVSSPAYMLNTAAGVIFAVILGGAMIFASGEVKLLAELLAPIGNIIPIVFTAAIIFTTGMNTISAPSVSLEGECLWIIKSAPIRARDVLLGKAICHIIITAPPTLAVSVIAAVMSGASIYEIPFMILLPLLSSSAFALLGVVLNVAFPKFEFESEVQPIKQSLPVGLAMLAGTLLGMLCFGGGVALFFVASSLLAFIAISAFMLALAALLIFLLLGPCSRRFEKL